MNVVVAQAARALAALGHRIDIVTRRCDPAQPAAAVISPGVTLRHLDAGPPKAFAKSAIDAYIPDFTEAFSALADNLAAEASPAGGTPYDLVHSHHWMSGVAALPVARAWGMPHVQSYHSVAALPGSALSEGEPPESPPRVPGEALLARESDLVVAISAAEARTVIERCGADPAHVAIVPPGVDGGLFRPAAAGEADTAAAARLAPHGHGCALFAGRLQPLKGPDLAIAALAHIPEPIRPDLVLAGAASIDFADYTAHLHRLIAELGLDGYVHFVGSQSRAELARLLQAATVCLVPSHSETFGLIALEAAAAGTPVIAAAAGGLREAVVHGESGQLMDSRHPEDWAVAMMKLLTQPRLLARMGVVARVHARRFTWEAMASNLTRLYGELLRDFTKHNRFAAAFPGDFRQSDRLSGRNLDGRGGAVTEPGEEEAKTFPIRPAPSSESADTRSARPPRYLFIHAHPDDETLSSGAAILALRRQGAEPLVVTATRGERGEVVPQAAACLGRSGLSAYRLTERTRALAALGAGDAGFLGQAPNRLPGRPSRSYADSGMAWLADGQAGPAPDAPDDALTRAPLAEVAADIVATARHWRADALVTYDSAGGYGHPDHVCCHEAAVHAAAALGLPCFELVARIAEQPLERGRESRDAAGQSDGAEVTDGDGRDRMGQGGATGPDGRPIRQPGRSAGQGGSRLGQVGGKAEAQGGHGSGCESRTRPCCGKAEQGGSPRGDDGRQDDDGRPDVEWYDAGPDRDRLLAAHRSYASQFTLDATGTRLTHVGGQSAPVVTQTGLRRAAPPPF
jgi:D-inositol-3-phosphate glycosyltransferase